MWAIYWKRFWITQGFILVMAAVLRFYFERPPSFVLAVFVMMQVAAIWGAWWGHRLGLRMNERDGEDRR